MWRMTKNSTIVPFKFKFLKSLEPTINKACSQQLTFVNKRSLATADYVHKI